MARLNVNLDEKARKCVGLGKSIAHAEGDGWLDAVHLIQAAILAFPEEAARGFRESGTGGTEALRDLVAAPDDIQPDQNRMPITPGLAAIVRQLSRAGKTISLERLIKAILRRPTIRVKALVHRARGAAKPSARRWSIKGNARPYAARRDRLADVHREWKLRRAAALSCGLDTEPFAADLPQGKPYGQDGVLDTVLTVAAMTREKIEVSPASSDPLEGLAEALDPVERAICEGILVHELFGLDPRPFPGLAVRDLAQMLGPEVYPANCQKVLAAVERLENSGLVARRDPDGPALLAERVRLASHVLDQVLAALAHDTISAGEMKAMKREVRMATGWNGAGAANAM